MGDPIMAPIMSMEMAESIKMHEGDIPKPCLGVDSTGQACTSKWYTPYCGEQKAVLCWRRWTSYWKGGSCKYKWECLPPLVQNAVNEFYALEPTTWYAREMWNLVWEDLRLMLNEIIKRDCPRHRRRGQSSFEALVWYLREMGDEIKRGKPPPHMRDYVDSIKRGTPPP